MAQRHFNSLSSWNLNERTGEWQVNADNNWVRNGSFEADRKTIPSTVKPVQQYLSGWYTTIVKGRSISLDSNSVILNHENTESDRKVVVGERSLNFSDQIDFAHKVTQNIMSTPFVKLPDGNYTLSAMVKNSDGFKKLAMYAGNRKTHKYIDLKHANSSWVSVRIEHVRVKGGSLEIGFLAWGIAGAFCYVDDVTFIKE